MKRKPLESCSVVTMSLFTDDIMAYSLKSPKTLPKMFTNNELIKISVHKVNTEKSETFLYFNSHLLKKTLRNILLVVTE
jgi:hypothetical protein